MILIVRSSFSLNFGKTSVVSLGLLCFEVVLDFGSSRKEFAFLNWFPLRGIRYLAKLDKYNVIKNNQICSNRDIFFAAH